MRSASSSRPLCSSPIAASKKRPAGLLWLIAEALRVGVNLGPHPRGADHVAMWIMKLSIPPPPSLRQWPIRPRCRWDASELGSGPPHDTSRGTHVRTDRHHGDVSPPHPRT